MAKLAYEEDKEKNKQKNYVYIHTEREREINNDLNIIPNTPPDFERHP